MAKLIFGCGYLGQRVARRWLDSGDKVFAVTRSRARAATLQNLGVQPIVADVTDQASLDALPRAATVLYAIGFDSAAGRTMREVYVEGLGRALDTIAPDCERLIYISSTSVYGQVDGQWVDEQSPTEPTSENGRICLAAEEALLAHRIAPRAIRLRLAGIYGPGRIPRRAALAAGEPIAAPADGFLNLIHVDDAARIVLAAEHLPTAPRRLYTVADGHPAVRHEYYTELARLVGGPAPRFVSPAPDAPAAKRAESNKRIANAALLRDLKVELVYPSYREGLAAIVNAEASEDQ